MTAPVAWIVLERGTEPQDLGADALRDRVATCLDEARQEAERLASQGRSAVLYALEARPVARCRVLEPVWDPMVPGEVP